MRTHQHVLLRMTEDLRLRGLSPNTVDAYIRAARIFLEFCGRPADQSDVRDVRRFLLFLIHEKKRSPATVNVYNAAVRFLFAVTLNRTFNSLQIPRQKTPKTLPQVLNRQEIASILEHGHNRKHKALFALIYGSGLRVSEAAAIKTEHIDSRTMRVFVQEGKGAKDRYTVLSHTALQLLREYWKAYRPAHPEGWLFPGTSSRTHITAAAISRAFCHALTRAQISKEVSIHSLRHSFATHLLENGVSLLQIKELLGHASIRSTTVYLHLANVTSGIVSPLDRPPSTDEGSTRAHA